MYLHDLLYGLRQVRKKPGFASVAIVTLALGAGLTATMLTIVYAILLRPLPFANERQIVLLGQINNTSNAPGPVSYPEVKEWRMQSKSFQDIAYWDVSFYNMESNNIPRSVIGVRSSANLFSLLGVNPILGRSFHADDDKPGAANVAVLSAKLWKTAFSSNPNIINNQLLLGDSYYTVVGIMPDTFIFPLTQDGPTIWIPAQPKREWEDPTMAVLQAVGRLKDNTPIETAQLELTLISNRLADKNSPSHILVTDYRDSITKDVKLILWALEAAVMAVWLIACINVASLLLANAMTRRREFAIRAAIGGNKWQLLRQSLTESAILVVFAGALGLLLSFGFTKVLRTYLETKLPYAHTIEVNLPVIGTILALSAASALLFGIWPALQAYRAMPQETLHEGSMGAGVSKYQRRIRDGLVIFEVALSLILLMDAGLLFRTISNLNKAPLGFSPDHLIVSQLLLPQGYSAGKDMVQSIYEPLLQDLRNIPGVKNAAISTILPMNPSSTSKIPVQIFGRPRVSGQAPPTAELRIMSPDLYQTLGIHLLSGRSFTASDTPSSTWAVIINQAFVRKFFPNEDPLGKQLRTAGDGPHKFSTIVGVVNDTHQSSLSNPVEPEVNLCYTQLTPNDDFASMFAMFTHVVVRTSGDPEAVIPSVRGLLQKTNPQGTNNITTMQKTLEQSLGGQTMVAQLVWVFAGAALMIVIIGLYGLLSYNVKQSSRDIAIRMSLGANRYTVMTMIMRRALVILGIGVVLGYIVWGQTVNIIQGYLYGVKPHDLLTYLSIAAVLVASGLLSSYIPARRASLVDPMKALRFE